MNTNATSASLDLRLIQIGDHQIAGGKPIAGVKSPFSLEFKVQTGRRKIVVK